MRIQVVSVRHLEFHNPIPALADGVDVAVCAGDLAPIETGAVFYLAKEWTRARHILYVPGNHEYRRSWARTAITRLSSPEMAV